MNFLSCRHGPDFDPHWVCLADRVSQVGRMHRHGKASSTRSFFSGKPDACSARLCLAAMAPLVAFQREAFLWRLSAPIFPMKSVGVPTWRNAEAGAVRLPLHSYKRVIRTIA